VTASITVTYGDPCRSRVVPCRTAREAQDGARTVVYSGDEEVQTVTVTEGSREVERWCRDPRTKAWRHVSGTVLGNVWT